MRRRDFLRSLGACTAGLTLAQFDLLRAETGFHEDGPYNGPLRTTFVSSTCGACPGGCGIRVRQVDSIPVRIDGNPLHPVSRGGLCPVGASALAFLVHPDRVKQPMLRTGPRGSGERKPISWDEAEGLIVEKLSALKQGGKERQLLFYDGRSGGSGTDLARRFVFDFGSPNFIRANDPTPTAAASLWGGEGTDFAYDLENARMVFCFGYPVFESGDNPVYYAGLRARLAARPEGKRGHFIVIDPRLSASAAKAESWVPIRPNTHGILALGMLHLLVKEGLYDREAVERWCVGVNASGIPGQSEGMNFRNMLLERYYPSRVSEETGVPIDQIISLARTFASTPRAIAVTGNGVYQTGDAVLQAWAIMALNAVTGRLGKTGGVGRREGIPWDRTEPKTPPAEPLLSAEATGYPWLGGAGAIELLPERVLSGAPYPVKVAILNNTNPIYDSPRHTRLRQAIQNIPFSVVITPMHNETSALADLVLPDCSFLEKRDLVVPQSDFFHPVVGLTQPVLPPLYGSRQVDEVVLSFGKRLCGDSWGQWKDYRSYLDEKIRQLFASNAGTLFSDRFKVSFESLLAERGWRRQEHKSFEAFSRNFSEAGGWWNPLGPSESERVRFPSVSGQFCFQSETLRRLLAETPARSAPALPGGREANGHSASTPLGLRSRLDEMEDTTYPLMLKLVEPTTTRGEGGRLGQMGDMGGYYQDVKWRIWGEINPETAKELSLPDKADVWVESSAGKVKVFLLHNPGLFPGVLAVPTGTGKEGKYHYGSNIRTILTAEPAFLTGNPASTETRVRVYV